MLSKPFWFIDTINSCFHWTTASAMLTLTMKLLLGPFGLCPHHGISTSNSAAVCPYNSPILIERSGQMKWLVTLVGSLDWKTLSSRLNSSLENSQPHEVCLYRQFSIILICDAVQLLSLQCLLQFALSTHSAFLVTSLSMAAADPGY